MYSLLRFPVISLTIILLLQACQIQNESNRIDPAERPRLVVGIVVDQMRYEYLTEYWDKFSDDGFKRMINEGYNFENMHFNYFPMKTGPGHAAVYTGAGPAVNGIVGNSWYNRELGRSEYVAEDQEVSTVGVSGDVGRMSPKNMVSTTWTDALKDATRESKVVGISLKDRGAILPAGHIGDMAFWFDRESGNFVSSTWYMEELPQWVQQFNARGDVQAYSDSTWNTLYNIEEYTASNSDDTPYEGAFDWEDAPVFPHELGKSESSSYRRLAYSPFGNTLLKDLALEAIRYEYLGEDDFTDVLTISFSSTDHIGHQFGPHSVELQDTYLRLDRDLAELFSQLDEEVGQVNYLVFLTSDHGVVDVPQELIDRNLPGGYFDRSEALNALSNYLNDEFGSGDWIEYYTDQQVYLNHNLIEEAGESLTEMQEKAADFLLQFEGVLSTNTAENYKTQDYSDHLQQMYQRGFFEERSGDVFIQLKPGWLDRSSSTGTNHVSPYNYDTHVPMLMHGWGVPQGSTSKRVEISLIAPTISNMLGISLPSGSPANVLSFEE